MRILHLLASPVFSGPAENVLLLARAQRALGHEVEVAIDRTREGTGSEEPAAPRFREAGLLAEVPLGLSTKAGVGQALRDVSALRRLAADLVHAHFSHDHWLARLAGRRPLVRSIHAPRSLRRAMPRADGFTLPAGVRHALRAPVFEWPALVDETFRPGDREQVRRRLGISGAPVIGMVSTFQASRRHAVALEAFAHLRRQRPDARLVLVGDGVLEDELRARAAALGLGEAVVFAGYQRGARFVEHLQSFDEVWILGLGNDFSARAAAQARACRARVVAVAEGALPELADVVVEPTPEAIAAVAGRPDRRELILPSAEAVARAMVDFYERVGR